MEEELSWKYWLFNWGLFLSMGLLLVVVIRLSIIKQKYYSMLSRDNRINETVIPAARGNIVDRKGRVLAKSIYQYFKKENDTKVYQGDGDFEGYKFEGNDLAYDLKRQYFYGEAVGLITGYVGKVNDDDLKNVECGIKLGINEVIGRSGAEKFFDCALRGVDGRRLVETDAKGKYVRELGRQEPEKGKDLVLSIDAFWQEKIYKILNGKKASVIMSDPSTGQILAMVSSPGMDPNVFSYQQNDQMINQYLADKDGLPMLNRTISARYHPGSVFKPTLATAGLESGVIDKDSKIEDTGIIKVGDYSYSNWAWSKTGATDGMVDVVKALQRSNDIFFYRLGEKLGVERIAKWASMYGYGAKTGVELPGEVPGIVPNDAWKREVKGEGWYLGDTYHYSIGQGFLAVTPLQVNQMTNVIANWGKKCSPTILKDKPSNCVNLPIKRETLESVRQGMINACHTGGTAWPLFNFKTELACKTGTAEVGDGSKDTHAWLTAFAPVDNPEISITVMVERGGEGSDTAAPVVGDILKEWFNEPGTLVPRYKDYLFNQ